MAILDLKIKEKCTNNSDGHLELANQPAKETNGTYGAPDDDPNEMKHRNVKTQYSSFHSTKASFSFQKSSHSTCHIESSDTYMKH